jgi:hypothetical protein
LEHFKYGIFSYFLKKTGGFTTAIIFFVQFDNALSLREKLWSKIIKQPAYRSKKLKRLIEIINAERH